MLHSLMTEYLIIKHLHILCAVTSLSLFIFRAAVKWVPIQRFQNIKLLKILPHIIDTFLFATGFFMAYILSFPSFILIKLVAVVLYILCGFGVMRFAKTRKMAIVYFMSAILILCFILGIAIFKTPKFWYWY